MEEGPGNDGAGGADESRISGEGVGSGETGASEAAADSPEPEGPEDGAAWGAQAESSRASEAAASGRPTGFIGALLSGQWWIPRWATITDLQ